MAEQFPLPDDIAARLDILTRRVDLERDTRECIKNIRTAFSRLTNILSQNFDIAAWDHTMVNSALDKLTDAKETMIRAFISGQIISEYQQEDEED